MDHLKGHYVILYDIVRIYTRIEERSISKIEKKYKGPDYVTSNIAQRLWGWIFLFAQLFYYIIIIIIIIVYLSTGGGRVVHCEIRTENKKNKYFTRVHAKGGKTPFVISITIAFKNASWN